MSSLLNVDDRPAAASDRVQFIAAAGCFFLSGFAALLYQMVWLRQFSIQFGTSEQALAIVLGTYMGGLALGSILAGRYANRLRRPLLTYGFLELGIAATALLVPVILSIVRMIQVAFFAGADAPPDAGDFSQVTFAFLGATAATILPTTMMGATLPMLSKHVVRHDEHLGNRIGSLYAINTLGAVMGTLSAAFVCLPSLGLFKTILVGVALNVIVFLIVWLGLRPSPSDDVSSEVLVDKKKTSKGKQSSVSTSVPAATWILWLIACSGAVSFAYEILFTRMLGHILGGSLFAFASMLASFLMGITIGGAIAARLAKNRQLSSIGFFYAQCGTGVLALLSWYGLEALAGHINELALERRTQEIPRAFYGMIVLLPPAITIGMTFPFAIRIHARSESDAAHSSAMVYAFGTVGSVLGAFLTGTFLLPNTNYQTVIIVSMLSNLVIAAVVLGCSKFSFKHFAVPLFLLVGGVVFLPKQPDDLLRVCFFENYVRNGSLVYVETGRSATVTMHNQAGAFLLSTNGLPESGTNPEGTIFNWKRTTTWLGVLPALLRPEAKNMLVVGFGGGVAPAHAPKSIREIDVFELEEGMIRANRLVSSGRQRDPMSDPRIGIILNDGRSGLALTQKKYDVIVSQPSHPWTAGASHLYTREFASLVHSHLTDDGVFVLWMDRQFVEVDSFRSLAATMADVFESIGLFQPNESSLLFVGSLSPLELPSELPQTKRATDRELFRQIGADNPFTLPSVRAIDDEGLRRLGANAIITTDNNNLLAMKRLDTEYNAQKDDAINALITEHDPLIRDADKIDSSERLGIAIRRMRIGRSENAKRVIETMKDAALREYGEGTLAFLQSQLEEAAMHFRQSTDEDPSYQPGWVMRYLVSTMLPEGSSVGADLESIRSSLNPPYVSIVKAVEAFNSKEYTDMQKVDSELAKLSKNDPVFGLATLLRVRWRSDDPDAGPQPDRGLKMLQLLRDINPYANPEELHLLRLKAAMFAGRPQIALSMAQSVAETINQKISPDEQDSFDDTAGYGGKVEAMTVSSTDLSAMRIQLINCLTVIEPLENVPGVIPDRFYGVRLVVESCLSLVEQKIRSPDEP